MRDGLPLRGYYCGLVEFRCCVMACRYWIRCEELGNCTLRVKREYSDVEIAEIEGSGRQSIAQAAHKGELKLLKSLRAYKEEILSVLTVMVQYREDAWEERGDEAD